MYEYELCMGKRSNSLPTNLRWFIDLSFVSGGTFVLLRHVNTAYRKPLINHHQEDSTIILWSA